MLSRRLPESARAGDSYTRRMPAGDQCAVCGQLFGYGLRRCPNCKQAFCESCAIRRGGMSFCGAACAHLFYFAESDEEDLPEAEVEE